MNINVGSLLASQCAEPLATNGHFRDAYGQDSWPPTDAPRVWL